MNFALTTPSPSAVIEPPGGASASVSFQATAQGSFHQAVTLGCSFTPRISGATCTFTPGTVVNPTSASPVNMTASVIVPVGTVAGNYTVTLQATTQGAPAAATASFAVAVTTSQDFTVISSTPTQTVAAGQTSGPYNLTVTPTGSAFSGVVTLSCSGIPSGAQCNFAPNPVIPGSNSVVVTMTIATNVASPAGNYTVMVAGTSGTLSHSVSASLIVLGNFRLAISQPFPTADAGSQQTAKVSATPNYTGLVNATCDATAVSGQCSVTPSNPIPVTVGDVTSLTVTLNIPNSAAPQPSNAYNITLTVTDSSGQPTQTLQLPLTVIQDFTVGTLTPPTQTVTVSQSASYNFSVLPVGSSFSGAVTLSCSSSPVINALCTFSAASVTPGSTSAAVVMTIATTASSANPVRHLPAFAILWFALPALALYGTKGRQSKHDKRRMLTSLVGLFFLALLLSSCGGGGSNGGGGGSGGGGGGGGQGQGTQPGTYTITVTGTSGTLSHQASPVTLIVNP